MNCPNCDEPMKHGHIDLKAWGLGMAPQARLHFNDELIAKDQYVPVLGLLRGGKKLGAHRCKGCRFVTFEY